MILIHSGPDSVQLIMDEGSGTIRENPVVACFYMLLSAE